MSEQRIATSDIQWEAESLRFTAFPPLSVSFEIQPLWGRLVGRSPEEVSERPQQGLRIETGALGERQLVVSQLPSRLDIVLGAKAGIANTLEIPFISLGAYESAVEPHATLIRKWLSTAPAVGRIAYAPIVLCRVNSKEEGYRLLQQLLPQLPIDPVNSQDLVWQINRPRSSKVVSEVKIYRLQRWTVLRRQKLDFVSAPAQTTVIPTMQEDAVRLELDISTEPPGPLPSEALTGLFDELLDSAHEIMVSGDAA